MAEEATASEAAASEARGRDLLGVEFAWPLAHRADARARFSRDKLGLLGYLGRKDRFVFFDAYPFEPDTLSAWVVERNSHTETYAASFRVMSDHALPSEVLDAVAHNHQPQFTLRNIGRVERDDVDPDAPMPLERSSGHRTEAAELAAAARSAEIPKVEPVELWSVRFVGTVRDSFRRLLLEDPWEWRFGAEVKANYAGPSYQYVVEGTHPDDLPDAWWGPEPIPVPEEWVQPPAGTERGERALSLHDVIRRAERGEEA
jgi:hypothetical protein